MKKIKITVDVVFGLLVFALLVRYLLWAVPFIGRYEPTMDPLPEILWRVFLDGPALTLAAWGLLQGAYGAWQATGVGFFWWSTLTVCGLFVCWYCLSVVTYQPPQLPVSADPHQIVAAIGGVCLTGWSILCGVLWGICRCVQSLRERKSR